MAHAWYRQYRPQQFSEVVGQPHITSILQEALKQKRLSHAYLFSGPRGSGKTTMARLVAKALNCQSPAASGEPCRKCETCQAIERGRALDVVEIDAASNRGIDEVRELKQHITTLPAQLGKKVVIIDEVHMLTREAFNALLKLLEEPPEHVLFILATTEYAKVPKTVISRCQHFAFRRAEPQNLKMRLTYIARAEKLQIEEQALELIAALAEGSYRDAIGLLDQLASLGQPLSRERVQSHLGLPPVAEAIGLLGAIIKGNTRAALERLTGLIEAGADPVALLTAISTVSRTLIYTLAGEGIARGVGVRVGLGEEELKTLLLLGSELTSARAAVLLGELIEAERTLKLVHDPRIAAERFVVTAALHCAASSPASAGSQNQDSSAAPASATLPKERSGAPSQLLRQFVAGVAGKNQTVGSILRAANLTAMEKGVLTIAVGFTLHAERLRFAKVQELLQESARKVWGIPVQFQIVVDQARKALPPVSPEEELVEEINEVFKGS